MKRQSKQNKPRPNPQNSYNGKHFAFINTKASHVFLISQPAYAFSNSAVALYLHLQCPYGPLAFPDEQAQELIILELILHVKSGEHFRSTAHASLPAEPTFPAC